jgi:peptide/nickel transport system permease protein
MAERRSRPLDARLLVGGGFVLLLAGVALLAPWLAPHDPLEQDLMSATLPPRFLEGGDPAFLLGTDDLGRDVASRLMFASRIALLVAVAAAALAALFGSLLGLAAGFLGGLTDRLTSRLIEIWIAFPPVLLSILIVAVLGSGVTSVIAAIAIIDWTRFARVVRAETMAQRQADYVTAAQMLGFPKSTILFAEIFPNILPGLIALFTLEMGIAVVVEAILSFVGLSVSSDTPTWGGMIASGRQIIHQAWWVFACPLLVLFLTVLAFNLLGDGLRRRFDPVMRR